jgi:hypothetical protein
LPSDFPNFRFVFRRFRPSPSRLCFGEAVFTESARNPQEQKTPLSQKFCKIRKSPQNLVVGARKPSIDAALRQLSCDRSMA